MPLPDRERAIILVKAWPQPSQKYGETVCCAGVTPEGEWRRLFPIRFRHLSGDTQFKRWEVLQYRPNSPRDDRRLESRRVDEPTLEIVGTMPRRERAKFLDRLIRRSTVDAASRGESLALVRPRSLRFTWRRKPPVVLEAEKAARVRASAQGSLWEKELAVIEPCPYLLKIKFEDESGQHTMACSDWETAATYFKQSREYSPEAALEHLRKTYEETYADGVALALGTVAKRPRQWLMLGVIRLEETDQPSLF